MRGSYGNAVIEAVEARGVTKWFGDNLPNGYLGD
jgi:hypothetical protein